MEEQEESRRIARLYMEFFIKLGKIEVRLDDAIYRIKKYGNITGKTAQDNESSEPG